MNLLALEQSVIEICKETGEFIRQECLKFDRSHIEQKGGFNNLVSYVDKEAERKLVSHLQKLLPQAGFVTEEGTVDQGKQKEYTWIIDPLDGTTNFMHGLPLFAISVGLALNNQVILGVVYETNRHECFHAIQGGKAYCNDDEIRVSSIHALSGSLLATGFPYYLFDKRDCYLEIIKDFLTQTHGIRRLGSAATDLVYVACGRLDGFFEYNLNSWDVAAGAFILQQAGGLVTDFKGGNDYLYGGQLCASNTSVHEEMLAIINQHWWK